MVDGLYTSKQLISESVLIRSLAGNLDERLDPTVVSPDGAKFVVFDLSGVSGVSSFGVREWLNTLRRVGPALEWFGYTRVSTRMNDQFNMISGFDVGGAVLSFSTIYLCDHCDEETVVQYDGVLDHETFKGDEAPIRQCQVCGREAELDDVPDITFAHVRSVSKPSIPRAVQSAMGSPDAWILPTPGHRLSVRPVRQDGKLVLKVWGVVDLSLDNDTARLQEAAPLSPALDLLGLTHIETAALTKFQRLLHNLSTQAPVELRNCPPPLLRRAMDRPDLLESASIQSVLMPMQCGDCGAEFGASMDNGDHGIQIEAKASCPKCSKTSSKPRMPVNDIKEVTAFLRTHRPSLLRVSNQPEVEFGENDFETFVEVSPEQIIETAAFESQEFSGRYEVICHINSGGMADIYLVRQHGAMGFRRVVIIKRIRNDFLIDDRMVRLFLDEARLSALIDHPNVIRVHNLGRSEKTYFMVTDFVHGQSVGAILTKLSASKTTTPPLLALDIVQQLCRGLEAAHVPDRTGTPLVHRDVTPGNVLVGFDRVVKLIDFGLAGWREFQRDKLRSNAIMGSFSFAPPEIFGDDEKISPQTDLWGAGLLLYMLLTVRNPFRRKTTEDTIRAVCKEPIPLPRKMIPAPIMPILKRALRKDATARYANASEMSDDIRIAMREIEAAGDGEPSKKGFLGLLSPDETPGAQNVAAKAQADIRHWLQSLFPEEVVAEQQFVRDTRSAHFMDALVNAPPASVASFFEAFDKRQRRPTVG